MDCNNKNQFKYQPTYTPSHLYMIPAGAEVRKVFRGRGNGAYGFNRISVGGTNLTEVTASAELNEEIRLFKDVQLEAIRKLFLQRSLLSPFIIQQSRTLEITLKNHSTQDQIVSVQLAGMDADLLNDWHTEQASRGSKVLRPGFFYGNVVVPAQQEGVVLPLNRRSEDMTFSRLQLASTGDDDILVSMRDVNSDFKQDLFLSMINDEFLSMPSIVPYKIDTTYPLELVFSNLNATDSRMVSVIVEAYVK